MFSIHRSASPYKVEYDKEPIVETSQLSNETQVGAKINYEFLVNVNFYSMGLRILISLS